MIRLTSLYKPVSYLTALFLAVSIAGCGSGSSTRAADPVQTAQDEGRAIYDVTALGPKPVVLGTALDYAILACSGITNVPSSSITGGMGVSPIASTAITGFSLILDASGTFSTSSQVTGKVFAANYKSPTPAKLTKAVADMQTAYTDAAGRVNPNHVELASGNIGGLTLVPGLYKWSGAVTVNNNVVLKGGVNDVWIFQIAGGLTVASGKKVVLTGGAAAKNIFWQVADVVAIGTTAHMEGQVLAKTGITMKAGATANGRLLAQTAVTLISNTIVKK